MIYALDKGPYYESEIDGVVEKRVCMARLFSSFDVLNAFIAAYRNDEHSHLYYFKGYTPEVCVGYRYSDGKLDDDTKAPESIEYGTMSIVFRCGFGGVLKHQTLLEGGLTFYSTEL
jgi:hypothetical protein